MLNNSWAIGALFGAAAGVTTLLPLVFWFYARREHPRMDISDALVTFFSFALFGGCIGALAGALGWPIPVSCAGGGLTVLALALLSRQLQKPRKN